MDQSPDNHLSRRAYDRASQGYTPERPAAWPMVLAAILCWGLVVIGFVLMSLPSLQWAVDHW